MSRLRKIGLAEWDARHERLRSEGMVEPSYSGPLGRHVADGDRRLACLEFDDSVASLRLWNMLLTEEERLHAARAGGRRLVGAMKDLGTVPVIAAAAPELVAFYPDGAWWTPCLMELGDDLFREADRAGIDASFCPVRAMLGAFLCGRHFPEPDVRICSAGAVCDDFSAIAQRLHELGHPVVWWEIPHRRPPDPGEPAVDLPGGYRVPRAHVDLVSGELGRVRDALAALAGRPLDDAALAAGIRRANVFRRLLAELRREAYGAPAAPLPALEMLVAEMFAVHFCSDYDEAVAVIEGLLREVRARVARGEGFTGPDAVRLFWVNPVADLRVMNRMEDGGFRLCGTDFMFGHALEEIPGDLPPLEALARMALADPMIGPAADRADRIVRDARAGGAEAVVISRIPGASHCATEGAVIAGRVRETLDIPTLEIEVPSVSDPLRGALQTRLGALAEIARARRDTRGRKGERDRWSGGSVE